MITVTAWFAIICYTTTIASCQTFQALPNATECTLILNKIKTKRKDARLEMCDTYNALVISQSGNPPVANTNYLLAK